MNTPKTAAPTAAAPDTEAPSVWQRQLDSLLRERRGIIELESFDRNMMSAEWTYATHRAQGMDDPAEREAAVDLARAELAATTAEIGDRYGEDRSVIEWLIAEARHVIGSSNVESSRR